MKNRYIMVLLALLLGSSFIISAGEDKTLSSVINHEKELWCHIGQDFKKIDPTKIEDLLDGTWVFNNGWSSNCEVK